MKFNGKKTIVLGGTSGIGLAAAHAMANAGSEVVAASRRGTLNEPIQNILFEHVDVLDRSNLNSFFERHAPFDYLVNAATGGTRAVGPFLEMDLDGFQDSFSKLWGYVNSVRLGCPHITDNGAIVLVSGSPARNCKPGYIAISTVGNAVEGFIRGVASEIAPIRINGVSPGLIDTPMFSIQGEKRQDFFEMKTAGNAIPRVGTPEEVAAGIVFALENEFVTGTIIDVDGGALLS